MLRQMYLTGPKEPFNWWLLFLSGCDVTFCPKEGTFFAISVSLSVDCSVEPSSPKQLVKSVSL